MKHYAKGYCYNCYLNKGRSKMASKCIHKDKKNYAKGMCNNCYQKYVHSKKKVIMKRLNIKN